MFPPAELSDRPRKAPLIEAPALVPVKVIGAAPLAMIETPVPRPAVLVTALAPFSV